jgi:hypothetical protein
MKRSLTVLSLYVFFGALFYATPNAQARNAFLGINSQQTGDNEPRIVNIYNFVRNSDSRMENSEEVLYETTRRQVELIKQARLPATWALQYDALINPRYQKLFKEQLSASDEIAAWWEIPRPLVEKAGLKWRGRFDWDWAANVGFSPGYSPEDPANVNTRQTKPPRVLVVLGWILVIGGAYAFIVTCRFIWMTPQEEVTEFRHYSSAFYYLLFLCPLYVIFCGLIKHQSFLRQESELRVENFTRVPIDCKEPAWFDVSSLKHGTLVTGKEKIPSS